MKPSFIAMILAAACIATFASAQAQQVTAPDDHRTLVPRIEPAQEQPPPTQSKPLVPKIQGVPGRAPTQDFQPPVPNTGPNRYWRIPHHMKKGAWLGVSTSPPSPALRRQLKLPEGTGLVVDFVQPKSPAEQIGLKQYDLLLKLDDQLLIDNEQLAVLVQLHKPGGEVEVTILREGERQTLSGKLAEHEVPEIQFEFQPVNPYTNFNVNPNIKSDIRFALPSGTAPKLWQPAGPAGSSDIEHSFTWMDGSKQITLRVSNDHKRLLILDRPSGKVMFEGSIESLEQTTGIPDEARDALKRLRQFLATHPDAADRPNARAEKPSPEPKDPTQEQPEQ